MDSEELAKALIEISQIPEKQAELRKRWKGSKLFLDVNCNRLGEITPPRCEIETINPSFIYSVNIWGDVNGEEVLLGYERIELIGFRGKRITTSFDLPDGSLIEIKILIIGEKDAPRLKFKFSFTPPPQT